MSAVCLVPSPPVMPWTMTLLSLLRKIDMLYSVLVREVSAGSTRGHAAAASWAALSAPSSMVSARVTSG
jgi:hypothetical protein